MRAANNGYADAARRRKVYAVAGLIDSKATESGLNPHTAEVAATIVEQLEKAPAEKWKGLAEEARQNELSPDSRLMLVNIFRQRAQMPATTVAPAALPAPPPPPKPLGLCANGCGKERDDETDQFCNACQVREIAGYLNNEGGARTDEEAAIRSAR